MTTAEFMDVQSLSVDDLRTRFGLAPSCQPSVTASSTDQMINQVAVAIECRAEPSAPPPRRAARGATGPTPPPPARCHWAPPPPPRPHPPVAPHRPGAWVGCPPGPSRAALPFLPRRVVRPFGRRGARRRPGGDDGGGAAAGGRRGPPPPPAGGRGGVRVRPLPHDRETAHSAQLG